MARTYKHEAVLVPLVFESIVSEVSANLASDTDLSINQVSFKYGTWNDIKNDLIGDDKNPDKKLIKYPLVCLIKPNDENYVWENGKFKGDLLILTKTESTELIKNKYVGGNYPNILNPIFMELKQVMIDGNYFSGYLDLVSFPKRDLNHLSDKSESDGYVLPDVLDGIVIELPELKLARKMCSTNPCVQLYTLSQYACINSVEMSGSSVGATATISFTAQGDPLTTYSIICEDATIFIDARPNTAYTIDFDRLGKTATSQLIISGSDGTFVNIPIVIEGGRFVSYGFNITLDISVNTSCGGYMPINMNSYAEILGVNQNVINLVEVNMNGDIVYHQAENLVNFAEVNSSMIQNFALPEIIGDIQYIDVIYTLDNHSFFSTKAILVLQTI